ncbi:DUF5719 family protein [Gulosibacter massiliensis]|uniref:DUF5719 family protein n=1 Tax=Gulosibacter massiliensis TaxID=2479839 RepID=UPI000F62F1F8|nr:DUF5719 family protein [Gulosibacter massiliensis]
MADRSPRPADSYRDFGIDPELVAAPALPDEDESLRLDELTGVPAYLGGAAPAPEVKPGSGVAVLDDEPEPEHEPEHEPEAEELAEDEAEAESTAPKPSSLPKPRPRRGRTRASGRSRAQEHRRRGAASTAARTGGTVAALAIVAASVWALGWMPLPQFQAEAVPVSVTPEPGEQLRVCPGPLQQLGVSSDASEITAVGSPTVASAATGGDPETTELGGTGQGSGPSVLALPGMADGEITQLTAAQTVIATGGNASGFSATACMQPTSSQWLLAGDTTVGHTLVIDVVNPGNVEARVNFNTYDESGPVSPSIPETVIAPGERQEISLAGIAPDAASLAIQVTSTGAEVASFLHETITSTLDPVGSDIVGPSALPSTEQVLPGLYVYERAEDDETASTTVGTSVRLANPNDSVTSASLELYGEDGSQTAQIDLELQPNVVIDYPITSLASGNYSVRVDADQPVTISGRVAPMEADEFGWLPSSPTLSDDVMVAVPSGPSATLSLTNFTDEARTVTIDGDEVTLEPNATHRVDAAGEIELVDADGLYAAVSYAAGGRIASFPVQPGNADAEPIQVTR